MKAAQQKEREALSMSPEARAKFEEFGSYKAGHRILMDKADEIMRLLDGAIEPLLIFVFGPTGVGKSTLMAELQRRLIVTLMPQMEADPSVFPHVTVEVPAPDSPTPFSWRSYYADVLVALKDPLISKKVDYPMGGVRRGDDGKILLNTGTTTPALARAMEQALRVRRPGAIILDEAEHLLEVSGGRKFLEHLKVLRSIANRTRIPHILVGTYELLDFMDMNPALRRRSKKVHMPRYRADSAEDRKSFNTAVFKFQQKLPCKADLMTHNEYLYEGSLGCVGLLKVWLSSALSAVLRTNRSVMTLTDLQSSALPPDDLVLILAAALKGETQLKGKPKALDQLREMLRLNGLPSDEDNGENSAKKGNRKPGQRNPVRDPVGMPQYAAATTA